MILLWATILAVLCGVVNFGEPLEVALRTIRGKFINHAPSGKVVIVGLDDGLIEQTGGWPLSNGHYAKLIKRLNALGVERIVLNDGVAPYRGTAEDRDLIKELQNTKNKIILTHKISKNTISKEFEFEFHSSEFEKYTQNLATHYIKDDVGYVLSNIFRFKNNNRSIQSLSSKISNSISYDKSDFLLDSSLTISKIRTIRLKSLDFQNELYAPFFSKKIVLIGSVSLDRTKREFLIGTGLVPTIFIDAVSIETLFRGIPIEIPWIFGLIVSTIILLLFLLIKNRLIARIILLTGMIIMTVGPVVCADRLIFVETATSYLFMFFVAAQYAWLKFKIRRARTNSSTGLPNLNALRELNFTKEMAVIAVRISNYAEISAILPPQWHDELALQIVRRLTLGADGATIYQGEEGIFGWVMADKREMTVHDTLDGLHALFGSPVQVDSRRLDIALSFGIDRTHDRSLANRFGSALVAAKEAAAGHQKWREYDPSALHAAEWKLSLVGRLDDAIDAGEIWVAYQPKLDIDSGIITGAEALVRWSHPERGEIGPVDFVMAAEAQNRIGKLTEFVLSEALAATALVHKTNPDFTMAVNLSGRLLAQPEMITTIKKLLEARGVKAEALTLEITESAAIDSNAATHAFMAELRRIGIKISIDDYGTGFSTLDYMTTIPASEIKIDRRFVSLMQSSQSDRVVVNSTIQLAHQLGRVAVAEGVEDAETLATLRLMGCDMAQGYFIARPITQNSLMNMLASQAGARAAAVG